MYRLFRKHVPVTIYFGTGRVFSMVTRLIAGGSRNRGSIPSTKTKIFLTALVQ